MHIDEYEKQQPVYELFAKTVASILTAAIEHAGDYRLQVVRARAKEAGSLRKKLINRSIDQSTRIEHEIKDLAGCRAILYTNGDVEKLINSGLIESNFDKDRKIRVNCVSPGPTETPALETTTGLTAEQAKQAAAQFASQIPMGRRGKPEEIAAGVLFLASDESSFVTGIDLPIDGGLAQT